MLRFRLAAELCSARRAAAALFEGDSRHAGATATLRFFCAVCDGGCRAAAAGSGLRIAWRLYGEVDREWRMWPGAYPEARPVVALAVALADE